MTGEGFKILSIHAIISTDNEDGAEGVVAYHTPMGWLPMVAADAIRLKQLLEKAEELKKENGMDYKVIRFDHREDVTEEIKKQYDIHSNGKDH